MISYGEGYKPLYMYKANKDNISKSGGIVSVDSNYLKERFKNAKKLTLDELEEHLKD